MKLTSANKQVKVLDGDNLHDPNVLLDIQFIDLTLQDLEDGVMFVWTGKFKGNVKKDILGSECNLVQPVLVNFDGKSCFPFDRNFIIDFNIQLDIERGSLGEPAPKKKKTTSVSASAGKGKQHQTKQQKQTSRVECHVCKKTVTGEGMRAHVGQHILLNDVKSDACGWCGGSCYTFLDETSKKKGQKYYKPKSKCLFFWPCVSTPMESTKNKPCTNYMRHCPVCTECVWSYNMENHFGERHPSHEIPPGLLPSEEELIRVRNIQYK